MKKDKAIFIAKTYKVSMAKVYKNRRKYDNIFTNRAYEESKGVNRMKWFDRVTKWIRLKLEISKLRQDIWAKELASRGSLLEYKSSGVPVLKLRLDYKLKEIKKLGSLK